MPNIFSRIKFRRADKIPEPAGKLYGLWLLILPLILGFSFGSLAVSVGGYMLYKFSGNGGLSDIAVTGTHEQSNSPEKRRGLEEFLAANPFKVSPMKPDTPPPAPEKPKEDPKPAEPEIKLDEIILRGTLPGIGAWFDVKNELKLVLVGKMIDTYKLISVNYTDVMFRRGKEKPVRKYMIYGPLPEPKKAEAPKPQPPAPKAQAEPKPAGNIVAAVPGTQEGQVPGELVSNLVQNPFDELKRIRIRPNERAGGLEVQWIQNDSLLKRLGVQRGDVIRSVNGIPFTNMGDIANSINSLMTSERFDVEVTRGGQNTALRYVVK